MTESSQILRGDFKRTSPLAETKEKNGEIMRFGDLKFFGRITFEHKFSHKLGRLHLLHGCHLQILMGEAFFTPVGGKG